MSFAEKRIAMGWFVQGFLDLGVVMSAAGRKNIGNQQVEANVTIKAYTAKEKPSHHVTILLGALHDSEHHIRAFCVSI